MSLFADRRRRILENIQGAAVFCSTPVTLRNGDVENEYRQDSDLYYLTGFPEPECVLVLSATHEKHRTIMFVRPRDPERETWDGARAGVDGAIATYGADAAYPIGELAQRLPDLLRGNSRLYYRLGRDRSADDRVLDAIGKLRGKGRTPEPWPTEIVDPCTVLHEMRLLKTEEEVASMQRAAEITREAHLGAMRFAAPGRYEYEIEALIHEIFRKNGSERSAYSSIVGSGPNATVLHYRTNSRRLGEGELLLIDAGCEYDYYASDVTRTFPVSGSFTPAQRRIYEIVLEAQLASIEATKPGATLDAIHEASVRRIVDGLLAAGLLSGEADKVIEEQTYKKFFMHRTSHWLGMDVHDVGAYFQTGKPRELSPGMALTVEPGIYIRADDTTVPEEYRGIGIRIEDDILVTDSGHRNLTSGVPKTVEDIERACQA